MNGFDAWLAAMPVEDVRRRIAALERELQVLRLLEAQHATQSHRMEVQTSHVVPSTPAKVDRPAVVQRRRRISPERAAIIRAIRDQPEDMSPVEVAEVTRMGLNAVQTNMSRMTSAGLLLRVEQGRYRLPPHIPAADLLSGEARSDEEAMDP